jgi:hypothetical protein
MKSNIVENSVNKLPKTAEPILGVQVKTAVEAVQDRFYFFRTNRLRPASIKR